MPENNNAAEQRTEKTAPPPSTNQRMVDFFGSSREFNIGAAILGPSIVNVLQSQIASEFAMVGMYQLGSGGLSFFGNYLFYKDGDRSMYCRMGMLSGGLKTLLGASLFAIGLVDQLSKSEHSNLLPTISYLGYGIKVLSTAIDLFNGAAYGIDATSATRELGIIKGR